MAKQFCTFVLDRFRFGLDVLAVQEIIRHQEVTGVPLAPGSVSGLINLRGQIVTTLDLRQRLEFPPRGDGKDPINIVVRLGSEEPVSLAVDEIGDVVTCEDADFEPAPETVPRIAREMLTGVYKLKDGLLLILDPRRATAVGAAAG